MQDEPLTPDEQSALANLAREVPPPRGLEDRVTAAVMQAPPIAQPRAWRTALLRVAAAVILFVAGAAVGRATAASPGGLLEQADDRTRYLLLLYGDTPLTTKPVATLVAEYTDWSRTLDRKGYLITAEKLGSMRDVMGDWSAAPADLQAPVGFFYIRASSWEEASAIARDCPHVRYGGSVEVRAVE